MGDIQNQFLSQRNTQFLTKTLTDDFKRRGVVFNQSQKTRFDKTLQHYMDEVYETNGSKPIEFLNKEVVSATVIDIAQYIRRGKTETVSLTKEPPPSLSKQTGQRGGLIEDTGSAFERIQNERNVTSNPMPTNIPDFRVSLDDDTSINPMVLYEQLQKNREEEALRDSIIANRNSSTNSFTNTLTNTLTNPKNNPMPNFVSANDNYLQGSEKREFNIEQALVERNTNRIINGLPSFPINQNLPQELMPQRDDENQNGRINLHRQNIEPKSVRREDFLIKQQDILQYKEQEFNLFVNSADRDWFNNRTDNRYSFTVSFNPANNRQGFGLSPTAQIRFKNISRIELVKTIIPAEGLDVVIRKKASSVVDTANSDVIINALSFPYISVRVLELDNNNFGTNNTIDNTFGVLQYDANWLSEGIDVKNDLTLSRGYLAMIPKFMKCQKVYSPTPLASLQKLTISFERPDGSLLSTFGDAVDIAGIIPSSKLATGSTIFSSVVTNTNAVYTSPENQQSEYYWIVTSKWFPRHLFNEGDKINIKGINLSTLIGNNSFNSTTITEGTVGEFTSYLTQDSGLNISGIGFYSNSTFSSGGFLSTGITTCANSAGYANCIIVRTKYEDPTSGLTTIRQFGNSSSSAIALDYSLVGGTTGSLFSLNPARLINQNHQTQVVFRVITREMDSSSTLRPDNL